MDFEDDDDDEEDDENESPDEDEEDEKPLKKNVAKLLAQAKAVSSKISRGIKE